MNIKGCLAVVSGAASGMGAATAKQLVRAGANVVLLDMNEDAVKNTAKELGGIGFACDVTQPVQLEQIFAEIKSFSAPLRVCINCAGVVLSQRMVGRQGAIPLETFKHIIDVNLVGSFNVMRLAAECMIETPLIETDNARGVIINTASVAAYEGQIGQTAYSASKGGIVALTLPAARELAQFGVRVMAIAPGLVDTPMFANLPSQARAALAHQIPFPKRLADPDEFAKLVLHVIDNNMLNGTVIRLDGALRMQAK